MNRLYDKLYREKHEKESGFLVELISEVYSDEPFNCIHSYLVSFNPGAVRAGHFHRRKEEWFGITSGRVELALEDIKSREQEKIILDADSEDYRIVYIPVNVAHVLRNLSETEKASLVVFSREPEDLEDTIKYSFD